jgi:hypothetical protein
LRGYAIFDENEGEMKADRLKGKNINNGHIAMLFL